MAKIDEQNVSELSSMLHTWADSNGLRFSNEIKFNQDEILVTMRRRPVVKDEDRKLVD